LEQAEQPGVRLKPARAGAVDVGSESGQRFAPEGRAMGTDAARREGIGKHLGAARAEVAATWAALVLVVAFAGGCGDAPGSSTQHAWLELGPDGERIVRAITSEASCPTLEVDGRQVAMQVRAAPSPPAFPVLTCESVIAADATDAAVGGAALPLPHATVQRLAVIGDTGCRIETGHTIQACNDPTAWPFAGLAHAVAELVSWFTGEPVRPSLGDLAHAVAALDPDLIVHVGDYLYRESPCPDGDAGCAGSPYGYNWATIEADFFQPAEPLLRAAPLVLTRGNHESCNRAGPVWFRFFDPRPYEPACVDYTEPYAVEVGGLTFLMFDSSNASDTSVDPAQVAIYRQELATMATLAGPRSFVVTHRPFWAIGNGAKMGAPEQLFEDNPTLQAASGNELPAGVEAVLSGHIHFFQLLSFVEPRVPQVVVGNSGTELDPAVTTPLAGLEIAGATVASGATLDQFGFATMEPQDDGWAFTLRDMSGDVLRQCTIAGLQTSCS
jgi:hypothetical protein